MTTHIRTLTSYHPNCEIQAKKKEDTVGEITIKVALTALVILGGGAGIGAIFATCASKKLTCTLVVSICATTGQAIGIWKDSLVNWINNKM